jgi:hypothetical protein
MKLIFREAIKDDLEHLIRLLSDDSLGFKATHEGFKLKL